AEETARSGRVCAARIRRKGAVDAGAEEAPGAPRTASASRPPLSRAAPGCPTPRLTPIGRLDCNGVASLSSDAAVLWAGERNSAVYRSVGIRSRRQQDPRRSGKASSFRFADAELSRLSTPGPLRPLLSGGRRAYNLMKASFPVGYQAGLLPKTDAFRHGFSMRRTDDAATPRIRTPDDGGDKTQLARGAREEETLGVMSARCERDCSAEDGTSTRRVLSGVSHELTGAHAGRGMRGVQIVRVADDELALYPGGGRGLVLHAGDGGRGAVWDGRRIAFWPG
ncbi:hypothetical protein THAOC_36240, partial [Thalassiosira oceanica]